MSNQADPQPKTGKPPDKKLKSASAPPEPTGVDAWLAKIGVVRTSSSGPVAPKKRRISRAEKDAQRTRWLKIGLAVAGSAIILLLAGGALNEYFLKPRKVLASVQSDDITREDYWKYRSHTLIQQALQYQQFAYLYQGEQQQQYLALSQQAQAELETVWGSTDVDEATLARMIDDKIYLHGMEDLGLSISDDDLQVFVDQQFADPDAPVTTPTPAPTLIPERAEWATQTAVAVEAQNQTGSPVASPAAIDSEAGTPTAAVGSDANLASPAAASPVDPVVAQETAQANYDSYADDVLTDAHMSKSDYERLIAKPALARQNVLAYFTDQVGQSGEQVHASHILVGTNELAEQLYAQVSSDPDSFGAVAAESSIDQGTASNGGDLGWFPRGTMVLPFEEVAFSLEPGEIAPPFQTEFGWHIVMVTETDPDRALTDEQISQSSQTLTDRWLEEQRQTMSIDTPIEPTPTPAVSQFIPPADAPPVVPEEIGTPVNGETLPQAATPVAGTPSSPQPAATPAG